MAAHPFGPIENQLIVGYYKRGFSPARVRPTQGKSNTLVPAPDGAILADRCLVRPVFYGWSPANGNSSSHDFRVDCEFVRVPLDELLSRGLGYRITFTMPEQEIRTEDPTSWPRGQCEILDLTGDESLGIVPLKLEDYYRNDPNEFEDEITQHLLKYTELQFEQTNFFLKIVENGSSVFQFPVYGPPGSSIDERHLAAAERHRVLLGEMMRFLPGSPRYFEQCCLAHACELFEQLKLHQISPPQKDKIKGHVHSLASNSKHFLERVTILANRNQLPESVKNLLPRMVNNLESDIRKWLDDEGPFPRYISVKAIIENGPWDPIDEDEAAPEQIFDALGIFHPRELLKFAKSVIDVNLPICQSAPKPIQTKSFTLLRQKKCSYFFRTKDGENHKVELKDFCRNSGNLFTGQFCVLSGTDKLLCCDEEDDAEGNGRVDTTKWMFYIFDLEAAYSALVSGGNTASSVVQLGMQKQLNETKPLICPQGIVMCRTQGFNQMSVWMLGMKGNLTLGPQDWQNTSFVPVFPGSSEGYLRTADRKLITTNGRLVYLARIVWEKGVYSQGIWVCLLGAGIRKKYLKLQHQQFLPIEITEPHGLFLTLMEFKNNRVFACAFTPDCRLWAFMYWRGRFVCAGRQRGDSCTPFDLNSRLAKMRYSNTVWGPPGILGVGNLRARDGSKGEEPYRVVQVLLTW